MEESLENTVEQFKIYLEKQGRSAKTLTSYACSVSMLSLIHIYSPAEKYSSENSNTLREIAAVYSNSRNIRCQGSVYSINNSNSSCCLNCYKQYINGYDFYYLHVHLKMTAFQRFLHSESQQCFLQVQ